MQITSALIIKIQQTGGEKMKRQLIGLFALVFMLIVPLAACGSSENSSSSNGESSDSPSSSSDEVITLNLGDVLAEEHPHSQSYYFFADRLEELTDGKVQVEVFVASTLGNQRDLVEGLKLGTVQIAKTMTTGLSAYIPEIQVFDLPYMFDGREHFYKVLDGEVGEYFANEKMAEQDFIGIGYFDAGIRSVYSSKKVESLDDLKGMKLRVPESPIFMSTMEAFGAAGTPMPVGDIYTSLQTGVIDGAENAPIFYESEKHFEVAPYFNQTEHMMTPDIVLMSKSYFDSLPEDVQDAILQAAEEMVEYERNLWQELEAQSIENLKESGVEFVEVDKTEFKKQAEKVWEEFADVVGQDMIDKIQAQK